MQSKLKEKLNQRTEEASTAATVNGRAEGRRRVSGRGSGWKGVDGGGGREGEGVPRGTF